MHGYQCSPPHAEALINIVSKTILCLDVRILELMVIIIWLVFVADITRALITQL